MSCLTAVVISGPFREQMVWLDDGVLLRDEAARGRGNPLYYVARAMRCLVARAGVQMGWFAVAI